MKINEIYEAAKARGLAPSKRRFSEDYLGRAPNYLADRGSDRCSARAILHLHRRLGEAGHRDLQARALEILLGHRGEPA